MQTVQKMDYFFVGDVIVHYTKLRVIHIATRKQKRRKGGTREKISVGIKRREGILKYLV